MKKIIVVAVILILLLSACNNNKNNENINVGINNKNNESIKVNTVGKAKDFVIVSSSNYDENQNHISTDYYYINNNKPENLFLFSSGSYNYELNLAANENEFILSTNGYNYTTMVNDKEHSIIFKITEKGVVTEKTEGLSIGLDRIDDNEKSYNMQGYISDIKINENKVFITLTDIKMKEEDALAFGNALNENDSVNILIIDNNRNGPFINVGDKIMISCRYTKDKEILYSLGADISIRN